MNTNYNDVIRFWFEELDPKQHFVKDTNLDKQIAERFGDLLISAKKGECFDYRDSAEGKLAEIIILDQFSRNIHRDKPESFAADNMALVLSQQAWKERIDVLLNPKWAIFLYMPFMHSESKKIHQTALEIFETLAQPATLKFEIAHKQIIDRFGRYPHRNEILGRKSTPEEIAFLKEPNSSF